MTALIKDRTALLEFIDMLPELTDEECYFFQLCARRKYCPELKAGDCIPVHRFTATKEEIVEKIERAEKLVDSFKQRDGSAVPHESLVLYMTANPRSYKKATFNASKRLLDVIQHGGFERIQSIVKTEIHKAKSRTVFVHFDVDVDVKPGSSSIVCDLNMQDILSLLGLVVGKQACSVLATRGGYHILIRPELVNTDEKNWYKILKDSLKVDQSGDIDIPVAGCSQGGFTPFFIKK